MGTGIDVRAPPATDLVVVAEASSGRILFSSGPAQRVVGRPLSDLAEEFEMFHPDGRRYSPREWQLARSLATGEEVVDEEFFRFAPDGSRRTVRCSSSPVYDDEGRMVAAVAVARDVTATKDREEQLAYHARLLDNTDDAIVALDAEWCVTLWNKGAERMYGWASAEVVGRHVTEVADLEMSDDERAKVRRTVAERGRWRGEVVAYRKDGTPVSVELITVAVHDPRGEISGYLGIHRDVTGRKRAEEMLRESQRRSATILESITDAFVAVDRDWRYTYVNELALSHMRSRKRPDLTREDVLGKGMWDLFPDVVGTEIYQKSHLAMRERRQVEFETYFPPDDEWIEAHVYPSDEGLSIYYRNITERKWAEQEREASARQQALVVELGLRALSEDLDPLLDEAVALVARTLEIELVAVAEILPGEDQLLLRAGIGWKRGTVGSATARADPPSLMGYTLAAGEPVVSDDLVADERVTPSALLSSHHAVSAATVVIAGGDEPFGALGVFSKQRRSFSARETAFLQAVANVLATAVAREESAKRMLDVREAERRRIARDLHDEALQDLTDALAEASRAEPGARLVPVLKRVGQQLRAAIYDLRLAGEEARPFTELLGDLVALQRALAGDCEIQLEVGDEVPAAALGERGTEVLRVVREALVNARRHSGARNVRVDVWGSPELLCVEVSDDGRGFDASAPAADGTGLKGMRERAVLLDADLDVSSERGTGTRVRFELALTDGHEPQGKVRVLLVEDHTAVREAIAAMFEREPGIDVVGHAASLAEARGMLEDVDVALIDLGLPDGSGGDLIPELRKASPRAQALVLSASLDRADLARAVTSGAAGALDKTAHLDEVVDAVRRLRAGETLLPMDEVVELLSSAGRQREQEREDRVAIERLTRREREVLQALADGLDSQAVADLLHISLRTERNHVANILAKLDVHSQLQALVFALRYDLVEIR